MFSRALFANTINHAHYLYNKGFSSAKGLSFCVKQHVLPIYLRYHEEKGVQKFLCLKEIV